MAYKPPPQRSTVSSSPTAAVNGSWFDSLFDGKDEVLLYVTATLGVVLPGLVYLLYQRCHTRYLTFVKKKEEERLADEASRTEAVVIGLGPNDGTAAKWAVKVHERLSNEMLQKPGIWLSDDIDVKQLLAFKGFCIFVVETLPGGLPSPSTEWLLDWLEDVAADSRKSKKANFGLVRFGIVAFGSSDDGERQFNKNLTLHPRQVAVTLYKRLNILGAKKLIAPELFDTKTSDDVVNSRFDVFLEELLDAMDETVSGAESSDSTTEVSDEDLMSSDKKEK